MLELPKTAGSGTTMALAPPCFRCLFEKPIPPNQCNPETCDMLSYWLYDEEFSWHKYASAWILSLELKNVKDNGLPVENF